MHFETVTSLYFVLAFALFISFIRYWFKFFRGD